VAYMFMETVLNTSRQFDWQNNEPVAGSGTKNNLADAGTHSTSIHQLTYIKNYNDISENSHA